MVTEYRNLVREVCRMIDPQVGNKGAERENWPKGAKDRLLSAKFFLAGMMLEKYLGSRRRGFPNGF